MKLTVLLTILAIVFGYVCLVIPEATAPFLAAFLIYFVWKAYDFNQANEKLQKDLEEIKSLLQLQNETNANVKNEETQISTAEDITASGNSENGTT